MYTAFYWNDDEVQENEEQAQVEMNTLLDEQEWLNFKLGLLAECQKTKKNSIVCDKDVALSVKFTLTIGVIFLSLFMNKYLF